LSSDNVFACLPDIFFIAIESSIDHNKGSRSFKLPAAIGVPPPDLIGLWRKLSSGYWACEHYATIDAVDFRVVGRRSSHVRFRGHCRQDLLILRITGFDPKADISPFGRTFN